MLYRENASADKFSADGVARNRRGIDTDEIIQELDEALGFIVLRLVGAHTQKEGFRELLDDGKLIDQN
jgi:hypothetical protein